MTFCVHWWATAELGASWPSSMTSLSLRGEVVVWSLSFFSAAFCFVFLIFFSSLEQCCAFPASKWSSRKFPSDTSMVKPRLFVGDFDGSESPRIQVRSMLVPLPWLFKLASFDSSVVFHLHHETRPGCLVVCLHLCRGDAAFASRCTRLFSCARVVFIPAAPPTHLHPPSPPLSAAEPPPAARDHTGNCGCHVFTSHLSE